MPLDNLVKEVQRKIGRNIILFQQLERLLKYVVANGNFSGYSSELEGVISSKNAAVSKQTMGQLVAQFVETSNPSKTDNPVVVDDIEEPHFSFDFSIDCGETYYTEKKDSLEKLVRDRNQLVHHLLPELDMASISSCKKIEERLDEQCEKIRLEIHNVESVVKALSDGRQMLSNFFRSSQGEKYLLISLLRQHPLVVLLAEIAQQSNRNDGWTVMNHAAQLLKQRAPKELVLLRKGTEHKSLKALMLKTGMFEFSEEITPSGGKRVLYKLKDSCESVYA
ncbi:hypothetical protein DA096_08820 [Vibrio rotiferianus]|uniref:hypothetical protein n=1 Tax=Vibrio rotiferianus TaxID=190895 RepID=UPI001110679F|nr:hypothetical protein [Vibrio rotiferianus]EGR1894377.1 hypothetical protein [Vibrio vulnificus]ELQ2514612.1 hypothetical protein [Vibrio vulnificus]TMX33857.1 hypothetical protein DA095_16400 [Vibrio rotiferianus]TMX55298.1 hypothetical protein DA093_08065 [Vibrio rotiferianus]TMX66277.1 hypothetical protein DA096_08820 [Vibrio rotiferianus]